MIIAIETSSNDFSITLLNKDDVINHTSVSFTNELSEIIVPTIKNFLKDNSISLKNISFFSVGCGPGSFTGIRSIISASLGIKISNNHINTIGINSLAGLAMLALDEAKKLNLKYIITSIDSKKEDLFLQLFKINYHKNISLPFIVIKDIETITIENLYNYIVNNNLITKDILFIGHQSNIAKKLIGDLNVSKKLKQYPNSLGVGKLTSCLIKNKVNINKTNFAFVKLKPVYVRFAQINQK